MRFFLRNHSKSRRSNRCPVFRTLFYTLKTPIIPTGLRQAIPNKEKNNMEEMTAIQDVVWILPDKKPAVTPSGLIHLPPEKRDMRLYDNTTKGGKDKVLEPETRFSDFGKCLVGTVVKIGPGKHNGKKFVPTELKPGDRVLLPPNVGVERIFDGKYFLVLREEKIYLKLEGEENARRKQRASSN
jgi:co-chaperonin GroES (HSP10)